MMGRESLNYINVTTQLSQKSSSEQRVAIALYTDSISCLYYNTVASKTRMLDHNLDKTNLIN